MENRLIFQFIPEEAPQTKAPGKSAETFKEAYDRLSNKLEELGGEVQDIEVMKQEEINDLDNKLLELYREIGRLFVMDIENEETEKRVEELYDYVHQLKREMIKSAEHESDSEELISKVKDKMPNDKWIDSFAAMPETVQERALIDICWSNESSNPGDLFYYGNVEFWEDFYNEFRAAKYDGRKVNWKEFIKKYR